MSPARSMGDATVASVLMDGPDHRFVPRSRQDLQNGTEHNWSKATQPGRTATNLLLRRCCSEGGNDSSWEIDTGQVRYCIKPLHNARQRGHGPARRSEATERWMRPDLLITKGTGEFLISFFFLSILELVAGQPLSQSNQLISNRILYSNCRCSWGL
jgi:hypothetical protein